MIVPKKTPLYAALLLASLSVTACSGNVRETLGLRSDAPDAFRVVSNPPLKTPPNFNLRPPKPGSSPTHYTKTDIKAEEAIYGKQSTMPMRMDITIGENALLARADAFNSDPSIRDTLDEEYVQTVQLKTKRTLLDKITKPFGASEPKEPVVHASKERNRISKAKADGDKLTGDEAIEVSPDQSSDGFLNRALGI